MRKRTGIVSLAFGMAISALLASGGAQCATEDDAAAYRTVLEARSPSIVNVKLVLKISYSYEGESEEEEQNLEILGVVVDPTGLILVNSAALGSVGSEMPAEMSYSAVPSDIKVSFPGDDEVYDAVVAVTDSKLYFSYIIIKDLKGRQIQPVDLSNTAQVDIGQELMAVSRYCEAFDHAPFFGRLLVTGKIKRPRESWAVTGEAGGVGLPVFDKSGRLAGVLTYLAGSQGTGEDDSDDTRGSMMAMSGMGGSSGGDLFLMPVDIVKTALPQALELGKKAIEKDKTKPTESDTDTESE